MEYEQIDAIVKALKKNYAKKFLKKYPTGSVYADFVYDDNNEEVKNQVEISLCVDSHECPYEGFRDAWEYQTLPETIEIDGVTYKRISSKPESYEITYTNHIYEVQPC